MVYYGLTDKLCNNETIQIFNDGNCKRDFTYVDDIVEGVKRVIQAAPEKVAGEDELPIPPHAVYNIGNKHPCLLAGTGFVDITHINFSTPYSAITWAGMNVASLPFFLFH